MSEETKNHLAIGSTITGVINLCAWFIPICGGPLAIVGIILGVMGISSQQRVLAIIGIVLSGLGLLASIVNAVLGAYFFIQNSSISP